jgi:hypothetical protein
VLGHVAEGDAMAHRSWGTAVGGRATTQHEGLEEGIGTLGLVDAVYEAGRAVAG